MFRNDDFSVCRSSLDEILSQMKQINVRLFTNAKCLGGVLNSSEAADAGLESVEDRKKSQKRWVKRGEGELEGRRGAERESGTELGERRKMRSVALERA